jgi:hypothetical protein
MRKERGKGILRERVKGRGIERKRRFVLHFLVKYPEQQSDKEG